MKFRLYEGRRTIPHTKAEMNRNRGEINTLPGNSNNMPVEGTNTNSENQLDLDDFVLVFYINFTTPSDFVAINSYIDTKTGKLMRTSTDIDKLPLLSADVSRISISFSLASQSGSSYLKDYYDCEYVNLRFKGSEGVFKQNSICDRGSSLTDATGIEVIAPVKFDENTLPKFGILVFSKLKQIFPDYVQQLVNKTREAMETSGEEKEINEI